MLTIVNQSSEITIYRSFQVMEQNIRLLFFHLKKFLQFCDYFARQSFIPFQNDFNYNNDLIYVIPMTYRHLLPWKIHTFFKSTELFISGQNYMKNYNYKQQRQILKVTVFLIVLVLHLHLSQAQQLTAALAIENNPQHSANQSVNQNLGSSNGGLSGFDIFLIIAASILAANILGILILCLQAGSFKVDKTRKRLTMNERTPDLMFKPRDDCFTSDQKHFSSKICYHINQVICQVPCYIIRKYYNADLSIFGSQSFVRTCDQCRRITKTIKVEKFGRTQCDGNLVSLVGMIILPLFYIYKCAADHVCWKRYFCGECGSQKQKINQNN